MTLSTRWKPCECPCDCGMMTRLDEQGHPDWRPMTRLERRTTKPPYFMAENTEGICYDPEYDMWFTRHPFAPQYILDLKTIFSYALAGLLFIGVCIFCASLGGA